MKQLHHQDIDRYLNELLKELDNAESLRSWLIQQLDLIVWVTDPADAIHGGKWRGEILMTCGGPTVYIDIDSRFTQMTLTHSWGYSQLNDCVQETIRFEHRGLRDAFVEFAEEYMSVMPDQKWLEKYHQAVLGRSN